MPTVFIPAQLRSLTGGHSQVEVDASTVGEAIAQLDLRFAGIRARLCQENELLPGLQISINERFSRQGLSASLLPDSELHFLPVIGGG